MSGVAASRLAAKVVVQATVCLVHAGLSPLARRIDRARHLPAPAGTIAIVAPFESGDLSGMAKAVKDFAAMLARRHHVHLVSVRALAAPGWLRRVLGAWLTWGLPVQRQCQPLAAGAPLNQSYDGAQAVVFEAFECALAVYVRRPPAILVVLRDHEVLVRKIEMERQAASGLARVLHTLRLWTCAHVSKTVYAKMDRIVTLTTEDRDAILAWFPSMESRTACVAAPFEPPASPPPNEPTVRQLMMVGNFFHTPNLDALRWFVERCGPHLDPGFTLHLCGLDGPLDAVSLDQSRLRLERHGFVADVAAAVPGAMIAVSPVVSGGGVRIKNLLMASLGKVVVTTTLGNQGIGFVHGEHALVSDDPREIAAYLNRLAETPADAKRLAEAGRAFVTRNFGPDAAYERFAQHALGAPAPASTEHQYSEENR